ncbi:MAG: hemerythrin domain-containing protein [Polyangiaceae bacterium]|nr:hemerythrin domain-containing protein [Polyangiaceae bacterium]
MHISWGRFSSIALFLSVSLGVLSSCAGADSPGPVSPAPPSGKRATEPFRTEHVEVKEHLGHIHTMVGAMPSTSPEEQVKTMKFVVQFLNAHIKSHADWEEKVLYPVVDKYAGGGPNAFTASMRYEHGVVGRWIGELETEAAKPSPDAKAFARRTDNLLGLLWAHFEEEEEVLLPLLDKNMTPEQFEHEMGLKKHAK